MLRDFHRTCLVPSALRGKSTYRYCAVRDLENSMNNNKRDEKQNLVSSNCATDDLLATYVQNCRFAV